MNEPEHPDYAELKRRLRKAERALKAIREGQADTIMGDGRHLMVRLAETEAQLRRIHEMLSRTENIANVGSWEWECDIDQVYWSEELFRIFGRDPAAGAPSFAEHSQLYVEEDVRRLKENVDACRTEGEPYEMELRGIRADGEVRYCIARGQALSDAHGRVERLAGTLQDITEQKKKDERIVLLVRMLDSAPAAITIHDDEGHFLFANRGTLDLHGYENESDFLAVNLHELDVPESEELLAERFRLIKAKGDARFEVTHYRKDGSTFPLEVLARAIVWEGRPAVLSVASDITERKQAEAAIREGEVEKTRLMSAVEQAAEMFVITDAEGTIQYVNPAFETVTGYSRDEAVGRNPRFLKSGEQNEEFYRRMWNTLTSGRAWSGRMVNRRKDGSLYTEESVISPVRDSTGKTVHYAASQRDITENLRTSEMLLQAQKMESVGRLAGGVAHDFNNMLNVILGHAEMALEALSGDSPVRTGLEEIRKAAQRSAALTSQLLAFARRQTIAPRILELNDTLEGMLEMIRRLIGEDIELSWLPGAGLWPIEMDPSQMDQVLANLCVNARDAISGVGKISIETGNVSLNDDYSVSHPGFVPGEYVMLAVSDDGSGMDQETLDHVFEPFFTTKEPGKGTGLGLATVYGIVKQNSGFIYGYSEPGLGTTFKLYFPRPRGETDREDAAAVTAVPSGRGERILLVEDEQAIIDLGRRMLEKIGYRVLAADSPGEAMRLAGELSGTLDLLITDVVMPEMNGQDLAARLESLYPNLKVLFMSGYTANVIAHRGVLDKGVNFIQKPFSQRDLAVKVRGILALE